MKFAPAMLEDWMRAYYYGAQVDLGSSGVACWSFGQIREILGIAQAELDAIVFVDSQSYGGLPLREAVARRWGNGDPEWVMVTHGSSEAIFLTMTSLLSPGDEVVVVEPGYHSLWEIARAIGCEVKPWSLQVGDGYEAVIERLRGLVTRRTRMVVVNFPHNPTGITLTAAQQRELVEIVAEAGAYLVWDAAFVDLVYDAPPLPDPTLTYDRAISVGTFSKAFGLPGMRFGWCLAAPEVLEQFVPLRDRTTLHLSPLIEFLALRAVEGSDRLISDRLDQARRNRQELTEWVAEHEDWVQWTRPSGGVTGFPRLRTPGGVEALCHELGREHGVLLVPGACFGVPDRVRLGFGGPTDEFRVGLSRLGGLLRRGGSRVNGGV